MSVLVCICVFVCPGDLHLSVIAVCCHRSSLVAYSHCQSSIRPVVVVRSGYLSTNHPSAVSMVGCRMLLLSSVIRLYSSVGSCCRLAVICPSLSRLSTHYLLVVIVCRSCPSAGWPWSCVRPCRVRPCLSGGVFLSCLSNGNRIGRVSTRF